LLEKALCEGDARASLILASRLYRRGLYERASDIRRALALGTSGEHRGQVVQVSVAIRINACRQLARDAERRLVSYAEALRWIDLALEVENLNERDRNQLAARRERLLFKVKRG